MLPTPKRLRISALQSRISHPHDVAHRGDELAPALALRVEDRATVFGDGVVASAPLPRAFDPSTGDPAALFHAIEQGIERGDVKGEDAARPRLDELRDLVSMSRLGVEEREDEEFGAAFFQFGGKHGADIYVTAIYSLELAWCQALGTRRQRIRKGRDEAAALLVSGAWRPVAVLFELPKPSSEARRVGR